MTPINRIFLACSCFLLACDVGEKDLGEESQSAGAEGSGSDGGSEGSDGGGETDGADGSGGSSDTSPVGCTPGDQAPAGDGCNTCICQADSTWACTEIACPNCADGDQTQNPDGCDCPCVDGSFVCPAACQCIPGTTEPSDDGCNTCECQMDGTWACTEEVCPIDDDPFDGPEVASCGADVPLDALAISAVTLEGDTLTVDLSYSGGCETHLLGGCWDHSWAESFPVQTGLVIAHDNNDDPCDSIPSDQVTLDLTPIRDGYYAAYGPGDAVVHINLEGWPDVIEYAF